MKLAINGFGRIGRIFYRASLQNKAFNKNFEVVAVNDITDPKTLAHLLKYDSTFGTLKEEVSAGADYITVAGRTIKVLKERDPANLPWKSLGVDYALESTGLFTDRDQAAKHLTAGAKRVVISAPARKPDITIVLGVNGDVYDPSKHKIISMASCTTGSLAPPLKVLVDSFGVARGYMTTIHSYTNDQKILDLPHPDLRRARAAGQSIIPTTTGAARAIGEVIPSLQGKLDGRAMRVPTPDGSITDITVELNTEVSVDDVNKALKAAAEGNLKGIMGYTEEPIVSRDIIGDPHSSIIDGEFSLVVGGKSRLVKIFSWYDNEWGYSSRLVDLMNLLSSREP
ncbi:type I glyceraldehyde-3-phosphate dehydrogenase [Candidatus Bathyarchaeota archaeon]|jgi:glyceraldehyde 3-phosphate dehydrogenase|nr:type I glyceraldehyde-3-phosphate dehydrogenase [Candidatus Bathyarchaeota archaeon]